MTASELKPCPFCGEDMPPHDDTSWVRCFGCGVETGWQPTPEEAIAAWNRRADLAAVPAQGRVKPLVWDRDGRRLHLDETMQMSLGYDWDGYTLMRQEAYGLGCSYIIWPDHIGAKTWNIYGVADGLYVQDIAGEEAAKAAAQADYEARDEVIARLVEALTIAANRLQRCAVDYDTGSHEFIETSEWAQEARAAIAAAKAVQK